MTPTFSGEIQLAGWSDTHNGGAKVTFWLPDTESLEVFKGLTAKKGNTAGHRFMAALVEIGDDELPVDPEAGITASETNQREPIGDACYRAVQWCKDPVFWHWITSLCGDFGSCASENAAKLFIKETCFIESRKELDTDNEANKAWHREIREPYRLWLLKDSA